MKGEESYALETCQHHFPVTAAPSFFSISLTWRIATSALWAPEITDDCSLDPTSFSGQQALHLVAARGPPPTPVAANPRLLSYNREPWPYRCGISAHVAANVSVADRISRALPLHHSILSHPSLPQRWPGACSGFLLTPNHRRPHQV